MSHGYRRWFHLRPGISLLLENYYLQENLVVENASNQPCTYLELGFNIFGYDPSLDFKTGQNFIQLALDTGEGSWKQWQAQERVLKLDIHIEYTLLKSLIFAHLDKLPTKFRDIIDKANDEEVDYWQVGRTTPKMQTILQQVLKIVHIKI
jgi:AraC family transcriptional activator of pyochelin receptor